jgi:hypothetical protein
MSSKECRDENLIYRIDKRDGFGRQGHYSDIVINIRNLSGVSMGNIQEEKNSKGHLNSLTASLQFMMEPTGKICFNQVRCNPCLLIRPPRSRKIPSGITLEGSVVF